MTIGASLPPQAAREKRTRERARVDEVISCLRGPKCVSGCNCRGPDASRAKSVSSHQGDPRSSGDLTAPAPVVVGAAVPGRGAVSSPPHDRPRSSKLAQHHLQNALLVVRQVARSCSRSPATLPLFSSPAFPTPTAASVGRPRLLAGASSTAVATLSSLEQVDGAREALLGSFDSATREQMEGRARVVRSELTPADAYLEIPGGGRGSR